MAESLPHVIDGKALGGLMRRVLLLALSVVGVLALGGCPPKLKQGECKTSQDCLKQEGAGKVCVEGRCQECAVDGDCREGFVCRENACVPKPQCTTDDQCPPGQSCQDERCVPRQAGAHQSLARPARGRRSGGPTPARRRDRKSGGEGKSVGRVG